LAYGSSRSASTSPSKLERRGAAPQRTGGAQLAFRQPAFVQQFAHQQADGRLGQADAFSQGGTRQPRLAAQLAHQGHAVDLLEQLLVASDDHRVGLRFGMCGDHTRSHYRWCIPATLQHLGARICSIN
jgi:hypothetical protein